MEILNAMTGLLNPLTFLLFLIGIIFGIVLGILPGLGGVTAAVLLLPLTFGMSLENASVIMVGAMVATVFAGSVTAILLNVPGTSSNIATCIDGYPMAQQGKAGIALGAAGMSSALGGVFGGLVLILIMPVMRQAVLAFSYQDYLLFVLFGLLIIAVLSSQENVLKGIACGSLGLALSSVGFDPITGLQRFTFASTYLWDGIKLVPVAIGLFALTEAIELHMRGKSIASVNYVPSMSQIFEGFANVFRNMGLFLRSSIIGTVIGIIPGLGGPVAVMLSYAQGMQTAQGKSDFGHGDIRGIIAAEASNNAKDGGALIPTLAFGIPGSAEMAILLAAFTLHGLGPGTNLLTERTSVLWAIVVSLIVANILTVAIVLAVATKLIRITLISPVYLTPIIVITGLLGAFAVNGQIWDVVAAAIFGALGYAMKQLQYSRICLIVGLILGNMLEMSIYQTIKSGSWLKTFSSPVSLTLIVMLVIAVIYILRSGSKEDEHVKA